MARALGKPDDYARYLRRSQNRTNVWNDALTDAGFAGFPNSRHADGTFSNTPARRGYDRISTRAPAGSTPTGPPRTCPP